MYACYIVFNNEATIRESLTSILPYVEKVVAVDGAYRDYPHKEAKSTDATKEIFFEVCADKLIWIDSDAAWPSQAVKRTQYLDHVPVGKWFIQIDGDEVIEGKVAEAFIFAESSHFRCMGIMVQNYMPIWNGLKLTWINSFPCWHYTDKPIKKEDWSRLKWKEYRGVGKRLYRKIKGMKYRTHISIMVGKEVIDPMETTLKDVLLINKPQKRGWERWEQNSVYKHRGRR